MIAGQIEISLPVKMEAGVAFWIDQDEWIAMSVEQRQAMIQTQVNLIASELESDVIRFTAGTVSATIIAPSGPDAPVNMATVETYEPDTA